MLDLTGLVFHELTVIKEAERRRTPGQTRRAWLCRCSCGVTTEVLQHSLRDGRTKSCGHLREANEASLTHGHNRAGRRTRAYSIWNGMLKRCKNEKSHAYRHYGGRGIGLDHRWEKFENFFEDMGEPPDGCSLERVDNDGPYCKDNCCWLPTSRQASNRRDTLRTSYKGRTQCLKDWCRELGLPYMRIYKRIRVRGWSVDRAFETE